MTPELNLIIEPSFVIGAEDPARAGWAATAGFSREETEEALTGGWVGRADAGAGGLTIWQAAPIQATPAATYRVGYYARVTAGPPRDLGFTVRAETPAGPVDLTEWVTPAEAVLTDWVPVETEITVPEDTTQITFAITIKGQAGDATAVWLDDVFAYDLSAEEDEDGGNGAAKVYPLPAPPPLLGHRQESWRFELLTLTGAPAGELDGVETATLEFNVNATIRGGGSLTWAAETRHCKEPDWAAHFIQPWFKVTGEDGRAQEWPMGVFIPAAPGAQYHDTGKTVEVELYDKLFILDNDRVERVHTVPAGANVVAAVRALIASAGPHHRHSIEDSTVTARSAMVWEPGTSKLRIINDLLESINYFSLWCDGYGTYRADHYTPPGSRPVAYEFADDEYSIYAPTFTREQDLFSVPNRVIQVGRGDEDKPGLIGVAENTDPSSPFSYQARGRWIAHVDEDVEAATQQVIDGIAQRRLAELSGAAANIEISHAHVPLELNDRVTFTRAARRISTTAVVQTMSYTCAPGGGELVRTKIREVAG